MTKENTQSLLQTIKNKMQKINAFKNKEQSSFINLDDEFEYIVPPKIDNALPITSANVKEANINSASNQFFSSSSDSKTSLDTYNDKVDSQKNKNANNEVKLSDLSLAEDLKYNFTDKKEKKQLVQKDDFNLNDLEDIGDELDFDIETTQDTKNNDMANSSLLTKEEKSITKDELDLEEDFDLDEDINNLDQDDDFLNDLDEEKEVSNLNNKKEIKDEDLDLKDLDLEDKTDIEEEENYEELDLEENLKKDELNLESEHNLGEENNEFDDLDDEELEVSDEQENKIETATLDPLEDNAKEDFELDLNEEENLELDDEEEDLELDEEEEELELDEEEEELELDEDEEPEISPDNNNSNNQLKNLIEPKDNLTSKGDWSKKLEKSSIEPKKEHDVTAFEDDNDFDWSLDDKEEIEENPALKDNQDLEDKNIENNYEDEENLKLTIDNQIKDSSLDQILESKADSFKNATSISGNPKLNIDQGLTDSIKDSLLSNQSIEASSKLIKKFMDDVRSQESPVNKSLNSLANITVEQMIVSMIEPKLETWLNQNLPFLVEKVIREEISKIIPKK
jgi:cell pole-organizing protein PopZ